ncbi:MAG: hypothetical protein IJT03_01950 [Clostridia bacterium]|nr:hypothetical protein [Clostridia bacterium]
MKKLLPTILIIILVLLSACGNDRFSESDYYGTDLDSSVLKKGTIDKNKPDYQLGNSFENINSEGIFVFVNGVLYFCRDSSIIKSEDFGKTETIVFSLDDKEAGNFRNINIMGNTLYWTDSYYIYKLNLDSEEFHKSKNEFDSGNSIDHIYLINDLIVIYVSDAIWTMNTDFTQKQRIAYGEFYDLLFYNGYIYFRNDSNGYIEYISLDGTIHETVYSAGRCYSLSLQGNKLYFIESGLRYIDLTTNEEVFIDADYSEDDEIYSFENELVLFEWNRTDNKSIMIFNNLEKGETQEILGVAYRSIHTINGKLLGRKEYDSTEWFVLDNSTYTWKTFITANCY